MSAIEIVIAKLRATSAVTNLVPKTNHFPVKWPEAAQPPANIINTAGDSDRQMLDGAGRYYETRVRIESLALSGTDVVEIGKAVVAALENVVKATIAGCYDVDIFYNGQFTDWADDRSMARCVSDFTVQWRDHPTT